MKSFMKSLFFYFETILIALFILHIFDSTALILAYLFCLVSFIFLINLIVKNDIRLIVIKQLTKF